jgi:hypothetical protein
MFGIFNDKQKEMKISWELVLENRITVCEFGSSMLTVSYGSVQSILKDNLNMSHCCQIFAPPAERSKRIILTHAKTFRQGLKGTQNFFQRLSQVMRQAYSTTYKLSNSLG